MTTSMKPIIFAALISLGSTSLLAGATDAYADEYPDVLPRTADDLRDLDAQQTSILREAERQCHLEGRFDAPGNEFRVPCMISNADAEVAQTENEALIAFHEALPRRERYDPRRGDASWQRMVLEEDERLEEQDARAESFEETE